MKYLMTVSAVFEVDWTEPLNADDRKETRQCAVRNFNQCWPWKAGQAKQIEVKIEEVKE